jgi:subtilisin family serine protease
MTVPVRIAVIDSGVHATHPHINGVAGGVSIGEDGREDADYTDRIGHGTAVTAVIREKAPEAEIFAVRIFHRRLATQIDTLLGAMEWSIEHGMQMVNLSLGTSNPAHEQVLLRAVERVTAQGITLVAAYEDGGTRWLPGCLPVVGQGLAPVSLDWDCPRDEYRIDRLPDGRTLFRASGYPRPIPGVSPDRNLKGISFAVANVTGMLAKAASGR